MRQTEGTSVRKVLFLDYDHVLHASDVYVTEGCIVPCAPRATLFEFAPVLDALLAPHPDVELVLSTAWVAVVGFQQARDALPLHSLRARVAGSTYEGQLSPASAFSQLTRGAQVLRYVARYHLRKWLALDDRKDGFESCPTKLIRCQEGVGLGDQAVQVLLAQRLCETFG
ncbi:HAD domain-containing protein [Paraburkholderia silviterrae]|uniref:Hydrolase n=1 Tax=Paraburkholderia silviterrae TaxID=2528715 RepID=A0A4R5MDC0_9BURK|nr:HAD domain-containing protein [Paraburkholderia silviterrae]TDG24477.1 hydrolase [Paraburkholderia silviterrae]